MTLCCGGLVDHGQLKQLALSSHPPPLPLAVTSNLTFRNWLQARSECVLWLWQNGKEGIRGRETEKERQDFNWERRWLKILESTASMQMESGREKVWRSGEEGEQLKRRVVQSRNLNSCQTIVRVAAPPAAVLVIFPTARSPLHICPRSSTDADLISKAFLGLKKSGHTLTWGTNIGVPLFRNLWWIDMSRILKVCIPKKERGKVEIARSWFSQGEMEEKGGEVKWKMAACQVAKCPFSCLLVLHTLLHHKHLIAEDKLQWTCVFVCTCNNLFLWP